MTNTATRVARVMAGALAALGGAVAGWHAVRPMWAALGWALSLTGLDAARAIARLTGAL